MVVSRCSFVIDKQPARYLYNKDLQGCILSNTRLHTSYTLCLKKCTNFQNGIAQNYEHRFWHHLAEIFKCTFALFSVSKSWEKANLHGNWSIQALSRSFWTFQPNVIKIDRYNFQLYCLKLGVFFETQCSKQELAVIPTAAVHINMSSVWVQFTLTWVVSVRLLFLCNP